MPKAHTSTSKAKEIPSYTELRIPYVLVSSQTEEAFVYAVGQQAKEQARQIYRQRYPRPVNRGGRPSIRDQVWEAADTVWAKWGQRFPPRRSAFVHLVIEVENALRHKPNDTRTIEKFLKEWMDCNLSSSQFPETLIKLPPRDGQPDLLRQGHALAAIGELARAIGPDFTEVLLKRKPIPVDAWEAFRLRLGNIAAADHKTLATNLLLNRKA